MPVVTPIFKSSNVQFIIDPGHGLPDGGSVATDGTTEQLLNLQIASELYSLFPEGSAVLSRTDEQSLSQIQGAIREMKVSDMKQRVALAKQYKDAILISVHMNAFPNSSVYGCQVFYRNYDEKSHQIALRLQAEINQSLQPDHTKTCKPIEDSLYLFKNTENPAILIECGFLSNPSDLAKLKNSDFQKQLALLIYTAVQQ